MNTSQVKDETSFFKDGTLKKQETKDEHTKHPKREMRWVSVSKDEMKQTKDCEVYTQNERWDEKFDTDLFADLCHFLIPYT